ncbi:hypothetical protein [Nocardia sp. NPDC052566]|uniref:hypothetical protein n=1 Tax=Nocardia sp. NPDC052566 TaxID=3364330 RepID=UPI0037CC7F3D
MLIAVTGLGARTGVTTTAVALAAGWPGPETPIVLEADPSGGWLAGLAGGHPSLGLASLATAATHTSTPSGAEQLAAHTQLLPIGVPVLAAPSGTDHIRTVLTSPMAPPARTRRHQPHEVVVIADTGKADPVSAVMPILSGADVLVVLVRADLADAGLARQRLHEIAEWCPRRAVVLIGAHTDEEFAASLAVPILGRLPLDSRGAAAILGGTRLSHRRGTLPGAARAVATALCTHLRPDDTKAAERAPCTYTTALRRTHPGRTSAAAPTPAIYSLASSRARFLREHPPVLQHDPNSPESDAIELEVTRPSAVAEPASRWGGASDPVAPTPPRLSAPFAPLAAEPAPVPHLTLRLFGPLRVMWEPKPTGEQASTPPIEITAQLQRRSQEVLALLAIHPEGVNRTQLIEALWGRRGTVRPANAICTTLARLRTAVAEATDGAVGQLLITGSGRYRLNPAAVSIEDYTEYTELVAQRRRTTDPDEHCATSTRLIELAATGLLAADLDADWLDAVRTCVRNEAITAVGALAEQIVAHDPRATAHLLEMALAIDPHNEDVFRDLMKLQARHGQIHAIDSTLEILTRRLKELDEEPSSETLALVSALHQRAS